MMLANAKFAIVDGSNSFSSGYLLGAIEAAMSSPLIDTGNLNAGFLRADANLFVIGQIDEDDTGFTSAAHTAQFLQTVKGTGNANRIFFALISGDATNGCTPPAGYTETETSGPCPRAVALQQLLSPNSLWEDYCQIDWATQIIAKLRQVQFRTAFTLARTPYPDTIQVRVNNHDSAGPHPVPMNAQSGWSFDVPSNTVNFNGSSVPVPGADIRVQYKVKAF